MEQNIYIPGDLVMFNNEVVMINEVDNAAGDENPFIYITCTNKRKSFYERSSEVNPIPLTPEILKKNGWYETSDGVFEKSIFIGKDEDNEEIYAHLIAFYEGIDGWDIDKEDTFLVHNIHYVSQLQHLLFGLGLDSNIKL